MNLSDHFGKFTCKTLKHELGITTVEEALKLSDETLMKYRGIGRMFCYHLRQLETKCRNRQIGLNTIMEKVQLPSNFQPGERVGLQTLIDILEEAKDGKITAASFTDSKVKYTISIPHFRNNVRLGYVRLANVDSALVNEPIDNGFHYNSKRDIQFREDQGKPSVPMISESWAEERVRELRFKVLSEINSYLAGETDRYHLVDSVKSILSGIGESEKAQYPGVESKNFASA